LGQWESQLGSQPGQIQFESAKGLSLLNVNSTGSGCCPAWQ
jgi:hypothetical protein